MQITNAATRDDRQLSQLHPTYMHELPNIIFYYKCSLHHISDHTHCVNIG